SRDLGWPTQAPLVGDNLPYRAAYSDVCGVRSHAALWICIRRHLADRREPSPDLVEVPAHLLHRARVVTEPDHDSRLLPAAISRDDAAGLHPLWTAALGMAPEPRLTSFISLRCCLLFSGIYRGPEDCVNRDGNFRLASHSRRSGVVARLSRRAVDDRGPAHFISVLFESRETLAV